MGPVGLDYETDTTHIFYVLAIDSGNNPQTGTATVTVFVNDLNDNVPIFTQSQYVGAVFENLAPTTSVLSVKVSYCCNICYPCKGKLLL